MNTKDWSPGMIELYDVYCESGAWRKYNWYDFLAELVLILKRNG